MSGEVVVTTVSRLEAESTLGRPSSRRNANRAAKIDELAGVSEANEGIFFPVIDMIRLVGEMID